MREIQRIINDVIRISTDAAIDGRRVEIKYVQPEMATQAHGIYVTQYYKLSATGSKEYL